jgi:hypothetical protein
MRNRVLFRLLIVGLFVFELAVGAAFYFFDNGGLDSAWEALPESYDWYSLLESNLIITMFVGVSIILVLLAGLLGVLLFKNWGRWLYLGSSVLILPISIFTGPTIYYGWESALWDISNMANGAIILAMFLPPISNEFNKSIQPTANASAD